MRINPISLSLLFALAATHTLAADNVHNILKYGANDNGKTLSTAAIQKAIDTAAAAGGGAVQIPRGTFLSGAIRLKSGVTLQLDEGATLLGSRELQDYYIRPLDADGHEIDGSPVCRNLINANNVHDIAIRGKGTIDGNGDAFQDKKKHRPKNIHMEHCRNVLIEGVRLRSAGSWMQHYKFCEKLTLRGIEVFNHVSFNNDGLDIDSSSDVTITGCRIDSDDDGICLKSTSGEPCRNVKISDCISSSHCNALKMGTESGGGFINISISNCTVFSPQHSKVVYGDQRGLAGIALEIVDGGRMENVTVSDVKISGVLSPIFLRLGNRARPYKSAKPDVGVLRNIILKNITAAHCSPIGCAIAGLPGHPIENVTLENIDLGFDGGGTREDTQREIQERPTAYPECKMFKTLPAYGFYCRHVKGIRFNNLKLRTESNDLRHAMVFDDVEDAVIGGIQTSPSSGAASLLKFVQSHNARISACVAKSSIATLIELSGDKTEKIVLAKGEAKNVGQVVSRSAEVPASAFSHEK